MNFSADENYNEIDASLAGFGDEMYVALMWGEGESHRTTDDFDLYVLNSSGSVSCSSIFDQKRTEFVGGGLPNVRGLAFDLPGGHRELRRRAAEPRDSVGIREFSRVQALRAVGHGGPDGAFVQRERDHGGGRRLSTTLRTCRRTARMVRARTV